MFVIVELTFEHARHLIDGHILLVQSRIPEAKDAEYDLCPQVDLYRTTRR